MPLSEMNGVKSKFVTAGLSALITTDVLVGENTAYETGKAEI